VLERKTNMGRQSSNLMQMVSDKDNIWELIGREEEFKEEGWEGPSNFLQRDLISLEKEQFRQDNNFFDKILSFSDEGKMSVSLSDPADFQQLQKMLKNNEYLENSIDEESEVDSEKISNISNQFQYRPLKRAILDDGKSPAS
jgi:hypothetical protein